MSEHLSTRLHSISVTVIDSLKLPEYKDFNLFNYFDRVGNKSGQDCKVAKLKGAAGPGVHYCDSEG
jgi:hypothetical protein